MQQDVVLTQNNILHLLNELTCGQQRPNKFPIDKDRYLIQTWFTDEQQKSNRAGQQKPTSWFKPDLAADALPRPYIC